MVKYQSPYHFILLLMTILFTTSILYPIFLHDNFRTRQSVDNLRAHQGERRDAEIIWLCTVWYGRSTIPYGSRVWHLLYGMVPYDILPAVPYNTKHVLRYHNRPLVLITKLVGQPYCVFACSLVAIFASIAARRQHRISLYHEKRDKYRIARFALALGFASEKSSNTVEIEIRYKYNSILL